MIRAFLFAVGLALSGCASGPSLVASLETVPVPSDGDAADDPAIWIDPRSPDRSLIIGTDKRAGLGVYRLDGSEVAFHPIGRVNNVDLREVDGPDGNRIVIVAASRRDDNTIVVYSLDPADGAIDPVIDPIPFRGGEIYGLCMWTDTSGNAHVIANDKQGLIREFRVEFTAGGGTAVGPTREWTVATQPEGMAVDEELGWLYIGEEERGVWRAPLDSPGGPLDRVGTLIDRVGRAGNLVADVEGIAIYREHAGEGVIVISSQGSNEFVCYRRRPPNAYLGSFRVARGVVDGVGGTDGLDASATNAGDAFPAGLLVVQDGRNAGGRQNFKVIDWRAVQASGALRSR